jgi:[ribosomal protein S18]-alanine N-acetyltransferase
VTSIRRATPADLDALEEIERHSFPRPWSRAMFAAELERVGSWLDVAGEPVIAFCTAWHIVDELHIHSIAVHPDHRRDGVGAALLDHVLVAARAAGCVLATLEVRRSNQPAIALYARAGFVTVNVRASYYQDNHEDALVMTCAFVSGSRR